MLLFSLGAIALTAVATAIVLPALRGRRAINPDDSARQNIRIARRRLEELNAGFDANPADIHTEAQTEIEATLLDDLPEGDSAEAKPAKHPGAAWTAAIVAMIPLVSVGLYFGLGTPAALTPGALTAAPQAPAQAPPVEALVSQLEAKLAENPGNAEGWALAGKTYMSLKRYADAERAYQTLHQLVGNNPQLLTAWADAALMANNGAFSAPIRARIARALEMSPDYENALWLAALSAESGGEYSKAHRFLERLLPLLQDGANADEVGKFIARMRDLAAQAESDSSAATADKSAPKSLKVRVQLDAKLAGEVRAGDLVYVFAKAVNGPPMPLAVSRHRASELPVSVTLDDSMAMVAGMTISNFPQVSVMARLSHSGDPIAQPGDLESAAVVADTDTKTNGQTPLELVINRVIENAGQ